MENFTVYNPAKLYFGRNSLDHLAGIAGKSGKNCLLVYGKGSIKNNGIYHQVINRLSNVMLIEYSGIKANPVIEDVENISALIRQNNIDFIVAVGGGSVIDSAKIASVCGPSDIYAWDFVKSNVKPKRNIPLVCVLTLAATGTEMNPFAVVQNNETREKTGFGNPMMYP
ncbi:MAG: iron-containing alcohol dehydrogenase, partial [Bacteroidota bacterium]